MKSTRRFFTRLACCVCLLTLHQSMAASDFTPMMRPDWVEGASVNCNVSNGLGMTKTPSETGENLQVETKSRFQSYWEAGLSFKTNQAVAKGDVLWMTVLARRVMATNEQREAEYVAYFQQNRAPWEKSVTHQVSVGAEWTKLELPFVAKHDLAAGEGALEFGLGFRPQTIEFSNLELRNYGKTVNIADLPKTRYDYGGREADAPWRKEALERIETLRKSRFTITVLDSAGKPVPGARVQVEQERSDFQFGTCVDSSKLLREGADGERYRKTLLEYFNTAVIENGFKWPFWMYDNPSNYCPRSETLRALDWLSHQSLELRGHNLVWPGWNYSPKSFIPPAFDGRDLRRVQNEHVRDLVGATLGKMQSWDVVNESLHERDYFKHMPEEESIDEWFKIAHEADPKPKLFLNDFEILTSGDSRLVVDAMVKQANGLKSRNVPVHGIGVQGHFGQSVLPMSRIKEDLDVLASTGLPIVITEFDVNSPDEEFAADLLRDMLILCYSHPSLQGFVIWGFWEKAHWIPQAAMFRSDWGERPSAKVWNELVLTKWKTKLIGESDQKGFFSGEGYKGTFKVEVTVGSHTESRRFQLGAGEASITVALP